MFSWCCFNIAYSSVTSSWSQVRDKYLKRIPMFVTVYMLQLLTNIEIPSISLYLCPCLYINVVALSFIDWFLGCSRISRRVWETVDLPLSTVTTVVVVPLCTTSVQTTAACSQPYICYVHQRNTSPGNKYADTLFFWWPGTGRAEHLHHVTAWHTHNIAVCTNALR